MPHPVQKLISAMLIASMSLQSAGCSSVPALKQSPGGGATAISITPEEGGWIRLYAVPTWSNGESPKTYLSFQAEKSDGHLLFAYEFGHGLMPVTFREAPPPSPPSARSSSWNWCCGGPDPVGAGLLLMGVLLVVGIGALLESLPKPSDPSPGCCFVWIEDAETGETLAGTPPWRPQFGATGGSRGERTG
jgi:hypothetical protein